MQFRAEANANVAGHVRNNASNECRQSDANLIVSEFTKKSNAEKKLFRPISVGNPVSWLALLCIWHMHAFVRSACMA